MSKILPIGAKSRLTRHAKGKYTWIRRVYGRNLAHYGVYNDSGLGGALVFGPRSGERDDVGSLVWESRS